MKRIFCLIFVVMFCISAVVHADVTKNGDIVTVRGNVKKSGAELTLLITAADVKLEKYTDVLQNALYIGQCTSGYDGEYEFTADISDAGAGETLYVWVYNSASGELTERSVINLDSNISDDEKVKWDIAVVSPEYNGKDDYIVLPESVDVAAGYGSLLSWSCADNAVTIENGRAYVDRLIAGGRKIKLTATAKINDASAVKSFEFTVYALGDDESIEKEKSAFTVVVDSDKVILPSVGKYGCQLSWRLAENCEYASVENGVLSVNRGAVTADITIKLKCEISKGSKTGEKQLDIVVPPLTDNQKAQVDLDSIEISYDGTSKSFTLPKTGSVYGSKITWKSSDKSIIEPLNGAASVNRTSLSSDAVVTLTAAAAEITKEFKVTVKKGNASSAGGSGSGGGGGGGSLGSSSQMTYAPAAENTDKLPFNDLGNYTWAHDGIKKLYSSGVINGMGDGIFAPEQNVTRAQFLKMLVVLFELSASGTSVEFSDVTKNDWCYDYVAAGTANGIVNGTGGNIFSKDSFVTRQDMAVMIYRCMKNAESVGEYEKFADDTAIADYAKNAVYYLKSKSIVLGDETGYFNPENFANRAEAAVMLSRCK